MLFLDLDHTIFPTDTIRPEPFKPLLELTEQYINQSDPTIDLAAIRHDLWHFAFDVIVKKYQLPASFQRTFYKALEELDYQLEIQTFPDYQHLLDIPRERILVTTGFTSLQWKKIRALGIEKDFTEIHIDDPMDKNRPYKQGIFAEILQRRQLSPQEVWVIGDSPSNEIQAANQLGIPSVQRLKSGEQKSPLADFAITSFATLSAILIQPE